MRALLAAAVLAIAAAADHPYKLDHQPTLEHPTSKQPPAKLGPLRCLSNHCKYKGETGGGSYYNYNVEGNNIDFLEGPRFFAIGCAGEAGVLDSPALPRGDVTRNVTAVRLTNCAMPVTGVSLGAVLAALNVRLYELDSDKPSLTIDSPVPAPPLAAAHFRGLELIIELHIFSFSPVYTERDFLTPLRSLRHLVMLGVNPAPGALDYVPDTLHELVLEETNVMQLPAVVHESHALRTLTVSSQRALDAGTVPPGLLQLQLNSPATTLRLHTAPALETLKLSNWTEARPPQLAQCSALQRLQLTAPAACELPDGWLASCTHLKNLEVLQATNLHALPETLFGNTTRTHLKLERIAIKEGVLESLPRRLLMGVPNLRILELKGNRLQTLPGELLMPPFLERLDASFNELDNSVAAALVALSRLTVLNLAHNPRLTDFCTQAGYSPIKDSRGLKKLLLAMTNVTRICRDWRVGMPLLEMLDLSHTNTIDLTLTDVQFERNVTAEVILKGTPVSVIRTTRDEYVAAADARWDAAVRLDSPLDCSCQMYWTRRALEHEARARERLGKLSCAVGGQLRDLPPDEMLCLRPAECAALPPACSCAVRPDGDPTRNLLLVVVRCERAALTELPRLQSHQSNDTERVYELLLAHNRITALHSDDLLYTIKGLDLRNNSLKVIKAESVRRLEAMKGTLRLAGNPLECSCHGAALVRALLARDPALSDLQTATCANGGPLRDATTVDCAPPIIALAAALAFILAAATICLASRERRFFLHALLYRWGCRCRAPCTDRERGRRYDAFITFSQRDEAVALELMARLEPPYRLCVHQRDWVPGRRIPDQIVESVHESRRTVALVSRHFLASAWARAEFREAHAAAMLSARPRLVPVLLEEPAALQMDDHLRRYVTTHTYLRWGEPFFWDKLMVALPRPRRPNAVRHDRTPTPHAPPFALLSLPAKSVSSAALTQPATD